MGFQQAGVSGLPGSPGRFLLIKLLSRCCVLLVIAMSQGFWSFEWISFITLNINKLIISYEDDMRADQRQIKQSKTGINGSSSVEKLGRVKERDII